MENKDPSMTLITDEEMIEITGAQFPSKQCQILKDHGIAFVRRPDGRPRTTWYNFNHPLETRYRQPEKTEVTPNWAALDEPSDQRRNYGKRTDKR
ncbi:DUF4224 domain-containing protein [Gibbsiella quercinecans]|uniref:DUF4224 domain-containing protein n=1 Tax=Gibbsiella quercinecans TaxID=929813 RepID=UPI001E444C22|nr:DUF4224 domain-containing protein [Gibbsiella quercinecans]